LKLWKFEKLEMKFLYGFRETVNYFLEPVILGMGKSLYKDISKRIKLKLIKSKIFESGVAGLYYQVIN
jgi:hypothetical protein